MKNQNNKTIWGYPSDTHLYFSDSDVIQWNSILNETPYFISCDNYKLFPIFSIKIKGDLYRFGDEIADEMPEFKLDFKFTGGKNGKNLFFQTFERISKFNINGDIKLYRPDGDIFLEFDIDSVSISKNEEDDDLNFSITGGMINVFATFSIFQKCEIVANCIWEFQGKEEKCLINFNTNSFVRTDISIEEFKTLGFTIHVEKKEIFYLLESSKYEITIRPQSNLRKGRSEIIGGIIS